MDWAVSKMNPMLAEVPQDSTLFPMLFNLYTSDKPRYIRIELAVFVNNICIKVQCWEDELVVVQQFYLSPTSRLVPYN